jgi:hypothetical protein
LLAGASLGVCSVVAATAQVLPAGVGAGVGVGVGVGEGVPLPPHAAASSSIPNAVDSPRPSRPIGGVIARIIRGAYSGR